MRRVGLLGGSFNPPHICHVLLSEYILETTDVEEVWWVPVHRHAFDKDADLAAWEDRLAMCEAVAADRPRIHVEAIEARLSPPSYTIHTVTALRNDHPEVRFVWIAGSDLLVELHRWHRWDELRAVLDFVVVGRGDETAVAPGGANIDLRDFALPDVSSSEVRRLLRSGDVSAAHRLVPSAVAAWLAAHPGTYR